MKPKKIKMTTKMSKLLDLLRRLEHERRRVTEPALAELAHAEAGYKEIKTYRSKYLDEVLIFRDPDDPVQLVVRGAVGMSADAFAELLSQRKSGGPRVASEPQWRDEVRRLIELGRARAFKMTGEDRLLLMQVLP